MARTIPTRSKQSDLGQEDDPTSVLSSAQTEPMAFRVRHREAVVPRPARTFPDIDRGLNDSSISCTMAEIHQLIMDVVCYFQKRVVLDMWSWTQVNDTHIWFGQLYELFSVGLGLDGKETLDLAFRRLKVDPRDIRVYLRMLIAVSVHKNIFTANYPAFPLMRRDLAKRAIGPLSQDRGPEYEDIIAQNLLVAIVDDESYKKTRVEMMEQLGIQLLEILNPLLTSNKNPAFDREAGKRRKSVLHDHCAGLLPAIFEAALNLRLEMSLKCYEYEFFWPKAGVEFDEAQMDDEVFQQRVETIRTDVQDERRVAATVLPGIRRTGDGPNGRSGSQLRSQIPETEWKVILKALVVRGHPDDFVNELYTHGR